MNRLKKDCSMNSMPFKLHCGLLWSLYLVSSLGASEPGSVIKESAAVVQGQKEPVVQQVVAPQTQQAVAPSPVPAQPVASSPVSHGVQKVQQTSNQQLEQNKVIPAQLVQSKGAPNQQGTHASQAAPTQSAEPQATSVPHKITTPQGAPVQPTGNADASAASKAQHAVTETKQNNEEHQVPKPPAEVPEEKPKEETQPKKPVQMPSEGIDTLEQDGGNWLLKRQALEKTIDVIEKIKDVFTKILEIRVEYLVKRNKTDRSFDVFANTIGFELGDLNQLLTTLLNQLKAERIKEGDLSEEEREVMQEVESKITELKGLKSTLKSITDMDGSLDEVLMQLEKEITTSNSYQTRAWKNFQTIKKVLSDEKAEELYLQTESLLKNMQEILKYLNGDLMTYFDSLISTLKGNMTSTEQKLKDLETKGISLKDEVKKIKKAEKLARKNKRQKQEEAKKQAQEKTAQVQQPSKAAKKEGWFDYVALVWRYPISLVAGAYDYVMSFFVTKKPQVRPIQPSAAVEKQKTEATKKEVMNKEKIDKTTLKKKGN